MQAEMYRARRVYQEQPMANPRSALQAASVGFGLLITVAWIGLIGFGVFELVKFILVELGRLILSYM
jgi:dolichyl-phosphate-mannose--protein O-mannosyl transferase